MKFFLKIGLPWALSLGAVFYLGLYVGDSGLPPRVPSGPDQAPTGQAASPRSPSSNPSPADRSVSEGSGSVAREDGKPSGISRNVPPPLPPNLRRIMKGRDIVDRLGAYLDAVRAMDGANVHEVVEAFEALPKGYGRHLEMKLLMRGWAAIDPEAALEYATNELDHKSETRFGISEVLAGWANSDPQGAIQWAKANSNNAKPEDNAKLVGIIRGLAENNLGAADELFRSLPEGGARWQASTFLAQEFAKLGPQEAIKWAENFPRKDERMRETILGQLGAKLSQQNLTATADWVRGMEDDKASRRITDNLLMHWVSKSPAEAATWVQGLENEQKRSYAMKQLTSRWSLLDPISTAQWLNTLPPSPAMDPAVGEFVNMISARDPEGAMGWALTIQNQESKNRALRKAYGAWEKVAPQRARNWKQANNLNF